MYSLTPTLMPSKNKAKKYCTQKEMTTVITLRSSIMFCCSMILFSEQRKDEGLVVPMSLFYHNLLQGPTVPFVE